jgi:YVTN family beta-propeller protein
LELRKSPFLLAILLEMLILMSTILLSHNKANSQTYDTIIQQREIFKNNPRIQVGLTTGGQGDIEVNPTTNKIYVANSGSNTVSIIDNNSGNLTNRNVGIVPGQIAVNPTTNKIYVAPLCQHL